MAKDKDKKKGSKDVVAGSSEAAAEPGCPWVCDGCGQDNEASEDVCCACEEPRPTAGGASSGVCKHLYC